MRLATRSGLIFVARLMARGPLGCFGMLAPRPAFPRASAVFHIFVTADKPDRDRRLLRARLRGRIVSGGAPAERDE